MQRQNRSDNRLVELHELICAGCRGEVADGPDGFVHVDGSLLCEAESVEVAR